jgi:hypothetical protein
MYTHTVSCMNGKGIGKTVKNNFFKLLRWLKVNRLEEFYCFIFSAASLLVLLPRPPATQIESISGGSLEDTVYCT